MSSLIDQGFLVQAIITSALSSAYHLADDSDVPRQVDSWKTWLETYAAAVEAGTHTKEDYERFRHTAENHLNRLTELLAQSKVEYRDFCESVVAPLLLEEEDLEFMSIRPKPTGQAESNLDDVPF